MSDSPISSEPVKIDRPELDETPPILGSWRKIYVVSLVWFVALVLIFFLLTKVYNV